MFTTDDPGISADELIRRARDEARRRRLEDGTGHLEADGAPDDRSVSMWATTSRAITRAERLAEIGAQLPAMKTMQGLRRWLAMPVARLILRAARLVTRDQTSFNVETIGALRTLRDAVTAQVRALEERLAAARHEQQSVLAALATEIERQRERVDQALAQAERRAVAVERTLGAWRDDAAQRIDAAARDAALEMSRLRTELASPAERAHLLDAVYARLHGELRGSRDQIKERARVHLDVVREAGAGTSGRPIVDLGCGRGEWLELLAESGLTARGVDLNRAMVMEGQGRGLDVVESDALNYLRSLPDRSCGALTGFHILEHLPFEVIVNVLDETVRALERGGVAIFETSNPQNLLVGACSFYADPTRRNPLHPDTMKFLLEARGLVRVAVRFLHPVAEGTRLPEDGSPLTRRLNEYLFGPQDFAVAGYRP
jgi:SAM-dependent methyltransferase